MGLRIAASAIQTGLQRQAITANNVANLLTPGFRAQRGEQATVSPAGTRLAATPRQTNPAGVFQTGDPLTAAIQGDGFFALRDAGGGQAFTRAGAFTLNADGQVVTPDGRLVEPGIQVPAGTTALAIGRDGTVTGLLPGGTTPQVLGQLQVVRFANPAGLQSVGGSAFAATPASGAPQPAPGSTVLGGFLEASNVELAREFTDQLLTLRGVQANTGSFRVQNDLLGTIIDLVR